VPLANRLLVTGLVRDSAKSLEAEINRIEKHTLKIFSSVAFFLVESDSTDGSDRTLQRLAKVRPNLAVLNLGGLEQEYPNRIERLRYCRNMYVNRIREVSERASFDFVMVVDFDIRNRRLDLTPLASLIYVDSWSGLFVNQVGPYYDIYALRKRGWVEGDCFKEFDKFSQVLTLSKAKHLAVWSQMQRLSKRSPLISVDSAFGGLALYRKEVFERFDYRLYSEEYRGESEHVSLHKKITTSGGKLFIVPAMTNFAYSPHNLAKYSFFRGIDMLLKSPFLRGLRRMLRKLIA